MNVQWQREGCAPKQSRIAAHHAINKMSAFKMSKRANMISGKAAFLRVLASIFCDIMNGRNVKSPSTGALKSYKDSLTCEIVQLQHLSAKATSTCRCGFLPFFAQVASPTYVNIPFGPHRLNPGGSSGSPVKSQHMACLLLLDQSSVAVGKKVEFGPMLSPPRLELGLRISASAGKQERALVDTHSAVSAQEEQKHEATHPLGMAVPLPIS
eukprot:816495-Pleurochrysis_carterae.AAC.5